ncbi:MAG: NAD(P)-binding protein, partial [Parvibaculum sp.]
MALAHDVSAQAGAAVGPSIAILGAGVSGICAAIKLKEKGFTNFTIYEKASEIGGT